MPPKNAKKAAAGSARVAKPVKKSQQARKSASVPSKAVLLSRANQTDNDWRRAPGTTKGYAQVMKQIGAFRDQLPIDPNDDSTDYSDALDVVSAKTPELLLLFVVYSVDELGNGKSRINTINAAARDYFTRLGCQVRAILSVLTTRASSGVVATTATMRACRLSSKSMPATCPRPRSARVAPALSSRFASMHDTAERRAQSRAMNLKELVAIVAWIDERVLQTRPRVPADERMHLEWFRGYLILAWHLFARCVDVLAR